MALPEKIGSETELKEHIIEWDIPNWSKALDFWKDYTSGITDKENAKVLAIGERNGGITLWLALQGFKVICTDYEGITEKAREIHRQYNVSHLITYDSLNIFEGKYADETFDIIICKSVIGGLKKVYSDRKTRTLEGQQDAVLEIHRMLKTGGYFLGAENMKGSFLHSFIRKQMGRDKGWRPFSVDEIRLTLAPFTKTKMKFYGFLGVFMNNSFMNGLSAITNSIISPLLPESSRYICFFSARK